MAFVVVFFQESSK